MFRFWHVVMNVLQNLLIAMRPGDFQHFRVDFADLIFFAPRQPVTITLPFSFNASPMLPVILVPRAVNKAAGVDDHHVRIVIARYHVITFSAEFGENTL